MSAKRHARALVWFWPDLRDLDHAALYHACARPNRLVRFVFDPAILDPLRPPDRRVEFIHASVVELDARLADRGGGLLVRHAAAIEGRAPRGRARRAAPSTRTTTTSPPRASATARCRPRSRGRHRVRDLEGPGLFERDEVLTQAGTPFSVFTPYKRAWLTMLDRFYVAAYSVERHAASARVAPAAHDRDAPLETLGFERDQPRGLRSRPAARAPRAARRFPARASTATTSGATSRAAGPAYLSVHLRFGTVSIRELARARTRARPRRGAARLAVELIWRDFYFMILYHHPHVVGDAFKPGLDGIAWEPGATADALFDAWCEGRTGYPLVDAAMRQINQTGYMHNRLRMVTAAS